MQLSLTGASALRLWPSQQAPSCSYHSSFPSVHHSVCPRRTIQCHASTLPAASLSPQENTHTVSSTHTRAVASLSSQNTSSSFRASTSSSLPFFQPGWSQHNSSPGGSESASPSRFLPELDDVSSPSSTNADSSPTTQPNHLGASSTASGDADRSTESSNGSTPQNHVASHTDTAGHTNVAGHTNAAGHTNITGPTSAAGHTNVAGHTNASALSQTEGVTEQIGSIEQLVAATGPYTATSLSHTQPALSPDDAVSQQLSSLFLQPEETISAMTPEEYANTLTIIAHLDVQLPRPVLPALCKAVSIFAPEMTAAQVSQTMYAFSVKKFVLSPTDRTAVFKRAHSLLSQGAFPLHLCTSLLCSCVQQQDMASRHGRRWDPKEGYIATKIMARFLGIASKALAQQFDTLAPTDVARSVWALSRLGRSSQPLLDAAVKTLHVNADSFSVKELCQLLNGFRLARHHPQDLLPKIVAVLVHQSAVLSAADITCCLQACALFNTAPPEEQLQPLTARMMQLLPDLSIRDTCVLLWSLGLLGLVRLPVFGELWDRMQELSQLKPLSGVDARQACQAHISARLQGVVLTTRPVLLDSIRTAWRQQVQQSEGGGETCSYVSSLLRRLGVRHEPWRLTKDGLSSIHIALQPRADKFIALQLLGSGDVASNTGQLLGPALWQRDLMQQSGWQVQFLKAADFKSISPPLQPLFLAELCMSLGYSIEMPSPQATANWPEVKKWQSGQWRIAPASKPASRGNSSNAGARQRPVRERGEAGDQGVKYGQRDEGMDGGDGAEGAGSSGLSEEELFVQQLTRQLQAQREPDLLSDLVEDDRRAQAAKNAKRQQQKFRRMHGR